MSYPHPEPSSRTDAITAAYAAGEPVELICARFGASQAEVEALAAGITAKRETRPSRRWLIPAVAAGSVLLVAGTVAVTVAVTSSQQGTARPAPAAAGRDPVTVPAVEDEDQVVPADPPGPTLYAYNITLTPQITSKHCFGSAGCNVNVKIKLGYSGEPLSDDDTWDVTYEISGDEDGPVIGTLELTGTEFMATEESLSTPSSRTKIRIKVTGVSKQGD